MVFGLVCLLGSFQFLEENLIASEKDEKKKRIRRKKKELEENSNLK